MFQIMVLSLLMLARYKMDANIHRKLYAEMQNAKLFSKQKHHIFQNTSYNVMSVKQVPIYSLDTILLQCLVVYIPLSGF